MKSIALSALLFSAFLSPAVFAETCQGPAPCGWEPVTDITAPPADDQLCLGGTLGCVTVTYGRLEDPVAAGAWHAVAYALVRGYPVTGTAGPCLPAQSCPAIYGEAKDALSLNARRAFRVMRFLGQ